MAVYRLGRRCEASYKECEGDVAELPGYYWDVHQDMLKRRSIFSNLMIGEGQRQRFKLR